MSALTERIQIDGSGNAYLITREGPDYIGWWNPSLRQFTFDDCDVWDVDPTTSIEAFLASFPSDEEVAEFESLQERGEKIDQGPMGCSSLRCMRGTKARGRAGHLRDLRRLRELASGARIRGTAMNANELAQELHAVPSQIADLRLREGELVDDLAAEMERDRLEVPELGVFERRRKTDRKAWDHEGLRRELWKRAECNVDPETGEIETEAEAQVRTIFECARTEWRTTALRKYGIRPDEFCETTYGGYSIQFTGALDGAS
jgi:hypothetical protein